MIGRLTWQVVALAAVAVAGVGLVAWLAPEHLEAALAALAGLAVGLPIRATRERPGPRPESVPPYRGEL